MALSLRARVLTRAGPASPASLWKPPGRVFRLHIVHTALGQIRHRNSPGGFARPATISWAVGGGFAIANARLARQRIPYAAECLGVAIKAHEMAVAYAKIRETFGAPLASRQGIQWMLVDNEIDIRTARLLVLDAAAKAERGEPFRTESAMAKLVAAEASGRVVDRSMQIHGGLGVAKDLPLERWYREIRIRRIGEGPSEVPSTLLPATSSALGSVERRV